MKPAYDSQVVVAWDTVPDAFTLYTDLDHATTKEVLEEFIRFVAATVSPIAAIGGRVDRNRYAIAIDVFSNPKKFQYSHNCGSTILMIGVLARTIESIPNIITKSMGALKGHN